MSDDEKTFIIKVEVFNHDSLSPSYLSSSHTLVPQHLPLFTVKKFALHSSNNKLVSILPTTYLTHLEEEKK
jgi:hypothetical protein